jgi:hypothetical protein
MWAQETKMSNLPKISISVMSGKMMHIDAINTNPLDNPFCSKMCKTTAVCKHCYSRKMLQGLRKNSGPSWSENGKILSASILDDAQVPVINTIWFRFSGHGELINSNHFLNLCKIATKNSRTQFVLWTKRLDIVRKHRHEVPSNMTLIYSNPRINNVLKTAPEGFHRVFNVVSKDSYKTNCAGKKCWTCGICYDPNSKEVCIIEKLKASKNGVEYGKESP